jgi:excinuclease UvrABC helicase subunit UvrB
MKEQEIWEKYLFKGKYHPEIEAAINVPLEQKKKLQFILEMDFNNNFEAMMKNMMEYAVDVEDYESAAEIRDHLKETEE